MRGLSVTLTLLPLILHVCGACPDGWHSFHSGGQCFKVFHESFISWKDAQNRCQTAGSVLAQVPDHSTHTHLIDLINQISSDHNSDFFLIGANNWVGSWTWTYFDSPLTFSHSYWLSGQPDNYCRPGQTWCEGQHCLAYTHKQSDHWGWDDINCSHHGYDYYICEKSADGGPLVG
ncbi:C-type lectin domain family 4 member C-like [Mizuhopecten yessoensis]|uniref:C-type lectin domain family 4 member C-like n=1 Tax=Mizuhopecten yessoensis TaxID=6573 RepID=UPI000B45D8B5|nr:C-type lectin domain family 4 member C-like [Mizuhopecten yessoensis]